MTGSVEVFRDDLGIPHVRAESVHDAFFGQGFVHAQDRLWQMTHDRYRAAGRSAELLGPPAVTADAFMRRMGLAASAREDYAAFDEATREVLDAYAEGVNAFLATGELPPELGLLDLEPEPWQPWDSGAVIKVRHVLMGNYGFKLWRARLLGALGADAVIGLGSADATETTVVVPVDGTAVWRADPDDLVAVGLATAGPADGSNSWAVHGSRTASGLPLVAGDPHRGLEVPGVYYQNHVACPSFDAIGLSMPGVPGMFHFGHNASVAWCVTHAMADTQDLFVERFSSDGDYEHRGSWLSTERRTERIDVRGADPVEIEVVRTQHGPVVFGAPRSGTAISMRWTAADVPNTTLRALLPMLQASTVSELDDVMRWWVDPCNSFVMADTTGTIGYLHRGRVPIRSRANAWLPVPGWTGEHEWEGDIPYEDLPRLRDPDAGFIVTANNRVHDATYPHLLSIDYAAPHRARRVIERLRSIDRATGQDMADVLADRLSLPARAVVEALADLRWDGREAEAVDLLVSWNRSMDEDSVGACLYTAIRQAVADVLCEREPFLALANEASPDDPGPVADAFRVRMALPSLLSKREMPPLDAVDWDEVLREGVERALDSLTGLLGGDLQQWEWGGVHRTSVAHPLSASFPSEAARLDPPGVSMGGDGDCVLCSRAASGLGIEHTSVARYVFDLADWDRSGWVVPLGSSGDPDSPHYADQAEAWSQVRLYPMTYSWDAIEAEATQHRIEPNASLH